jgi:Fe-S-cluster containining protein
MADQTLRVGPSGDAAANDAVVRLERQVERGSLHAHTALGASFARLAEMQVMLHGMADVLLAKGVLSAQELVEAMSSVREELHARGETNGPGLMVAIEPEQDEAPPVVAVDCAARMHVCQAVCCRLNFALSIAEIEGGHVRWDLGRPYFIRHEQDGCCTHRTASGSCAIYAHRPGVCRRYSCEHDSRIWKDFAAMELNTEWIAENLTGSDGPRAVCAEMHVPPARDPSSDPERTP